MPHCRSPTYVGDLGTRLFLSLGYAVIFLHRQHSLRPFERQLQAATQGHFIDVFNLDETGQAVGTPRPGQ